MRIPFKDIARNKKLENIIFISVLVILFKIISPEHSALWIAAAGELLIFGLIYFIVLYFNDLFTYRKFAPLSIILNIGVLIVILFFVFAVFTVSVSERTASGSGDVKLFLSLLSSYLLIGGLSYILIAFRHLFFLKQKKNPAKYYNAMLFFMTVSYFLCILKESDKRLEFIYQAFNVVTLVLISINSLRVSWIAFLPKKEKIYLLIASIVIAVLFLFNIFFESKDTSIIVLAVRGFSFGLWKYLDFIMVYGAIYSFVIFFTALFHLPTAEAFDRKAEEASSLMDFSKTITQVLDMEELSETVVSLSSKICNSDCSWLVTVEGDDCTIRSTYDIGRVEAERITKKILLELSDRIEETITLSKSSIRINIDNDVRVYNFSSIAIAPLKIHSQIMGYLFAAKRSNAAFDEEDKKAISAYAD